MREYIELLESKSKPTDLELVKLAYSDNALTPVLNPSALKLHFKLWQGYCDRYNKKEGDSTFNYAGFLLHNLFFTQFRPLRNNNIPNGPIGGFINSKFKSWDNFRDKFIDESLKLHGSGWSYLARDGSIKLINNHQVRPDIVILVDLWEHAYQQDYGSDKRRYITNLWKILDWNVINTRYMQPYRT